MSGYDEVAEDIRCVALYWEERKELFIREAAGEFDDIVWPIWRFKDPLSERDVEMYNMCFTEWLLFERPLLRGRTPLEQFVMDPPARVAPERVERLGQVAATQMFSRFAIKYKDARTGVSTLFDVRTGCRRDVFDPHLVDRADWRGGTIAERIACVDGSWQMVGQVHLYDRATPDETAVDGPGELHTDDLDEHPGLAEATYYLRLLHDVIGVDGRHRPTLRVRDW